MDTTGSGVAQMQVHLEHACLIVLDRRARVHFSYFNDRFNARGV